LSIIITIISNRDCYIVSREPLLWKERKFLSFFFLLSQTESSGCKTTYDRRETFRAPIPKTSHF